MTYTIEVYDNDRYVATRIVTSKTALRTLLRTLDGQRYGYTVYDEDGMDVTP